jgi:hypothetical protein
MHKMRGIVWKTYLGLSVTALTSLTVTTAYAANSGDEQPVLMAQLYDPGEVIFQDNNVRVYIDASGRQVTMNHQGKILRIQEQPGGYPQRPPQQPNNNDNWTLNGPVDGGAPYDGFANVPDNAGVDYFPAPPRGSAVNNAAIDRSALPDVSTAPAQDNNDYRPAIEDPYGQSTGSGGIQGAPTPSVTMPQGQGAKAKMASYQILLDRTGTSPGVIDGKAGGNVDKAAAAYLEMTGTTLNPADEAQINMLLESLC